MPFAYPAIFSQQRKNEGAPLSACFIAPVGEIRRWTNIDRLSTTGKGHQRVENASKVKTIRRFLELDERNTIPNALTVALRLDDFREPVLDDCATLHIPDNDPPLGIVIDGQHRLFGMAAFDDNISVNVVALINPSDEEIAFQFLVINGKVSKVPADHLTLLALQYSKTGLEERLRSARMVLRRHASLVGIVDSSPDSPFENAVKWPTEEVAGATTRQNLVLPASIERSLAIVAQKNLLALRDDDALLEFFFTLWSTVKDTWPSLWNEGSRLLSKVGLVTFTHFIIDDLAPLADRDLVDLGDPLSIKEAALEVLSDLEPDFWTSEWTATSLDTSTGRRLVVDTLIQIRRNVRHKSPWHLDVSLVESGSPDN